MFGSIFVGYYQWIRNRRLKALEMKSIGRPAIGGPFTLVDDEGRPVTDNDYRGKYMLIYFGKDGEKSDGFVILGYRFHVLS